MKQKQYRTTTRHAMPRRFATEVADATCGFEKWTHLGYWKNATVCAAPGLAACLVYLLSSSFFPNFSLKSKRRSALRGALSSSALAEIAAKHKRLKGPRQGVCQDLGSVTPRG